MLLSKHPAFNAAFAIAYIAIVVKVMNYASTRVPSEDGKSILAPMAFLSVFTLSAAVMGALFVFHPVSLYLDGKKKEGISFFFRTIAAFALVTIILFAIVFFVGK